jgi:hypothetical protein
MPPKMPYKLRNIAILPLPAQTRKEVRDFQGNKASGTSYYYQAIDGNLKTRNKWEFEINVPEDKYQSIKIIPIKVPYGILFPGLKRKAIMFERAEKYPYEGKVYCKTNVSCIINGKLKRRLVASYNIDILPYWFRFPLKDRKTKSRICNSKSKEGSHPVKVFSPDDHENMIKIYFILRIWPLRERFSKDYEAKEKYIAKHRMPWRWADYDDLILPYEIN